MSQSTKYEVGDVIRFGTYAFADAVVTHVNDDGTFTAVRPYSYATEFSQTALTGCEIVRQLPATSTFEKLDVGRIR